MVRSELDQTIDDQPTQMPTHRTTVAVLQTEHDAASTPSKRQDGNDPVRLIARWRGQQCKTACSAESGTGPVTAGAAGFEDHALHLSEGVLQSSSRCCEQGKHVLADHLAGEHHHPSRCELVAAGSPGSRTLPTVEAAPFIPRDRIVERIIRCLIGLILFGVGITLLIQAELGAAPWDVFHTGVSELTGISTGWVIVITGVLLLLLWIPLRVRPGLGTILNALVIGVVVDLTLPIIETSDVLPIQLLMMFGGVVVIGIGSGFYIGAGLGPGPRDGLMTGLAQHSIAGRSITIRTGRTFVEVVVLIIGVALGGAIGIGTAVFTFGIGPLVQIFLPRLTMSTDAKTARSI
jgi:uncharacterized membrane protein YczE